MKSWSWIGTKLVLSINYRTLCMFMWSKAYTKAKGHQRSSFKMGSKSKVHLIWKVEVRLEPNLVYWYNMGPFICSCLQRSYTKVKGHQSSSWKMGSKCKIHLIWKVEIRLEPNLVYWYNVGLFACSGGQRSETKGKCHVRSICKIAWKREIWLICILENQLEPCDPSRCGIKVRCQFAPSTNRDGRRH